MKRRLRCWHEDLRNSSGTRDTPVKETTKKEDLSIPNPTLNATNVEVLITSSKIALCGKMKKARETGRQQTKGNFNKTDFCKAMIATWGESESDAETENPKEEETSNLCLMASHESKNEKSKGK